MKKFLALMVTAVLVFGAMQVLAQTDKAIRKAVFSAVMHCNSCKSKVEKAIPFEKGVKDVSIDMEKQEVTVDYDPGKTNTDNLLKAFEKIKVEAKLKRDDKK